MGFSPNIIQWFDGFMMTLCHMFCFAGTLIGSSVDLFAKIKKHVQMCVFGCDVFGFTHSATFGPVVVFFHTPRSAQRQDSERDSHIDWSTRNVKNVKNVVCPNSNVEDVTTCFFSCFCSAKR